MDFELSDDQAALREVSRTMLASGCPPQLVRGLAESGRDLDEKLWRLGAELGWLGIAVPEELDGAGQGLVELCLVAEELGRAVAPGPVLETALLATALATWPQELPEALVPGLIAGDLRASWAHHGSVTLRHDRDAVVLTGTASAAQAADAADWLMVTAYHDGRPVLALLEKGEAHTSRRTTLDETRRWYDVVLDDVRLPRARVLSEESRVTWLIEAATALYAADALGVGERLLEMTVEYAKVREQFDRPLGSFQSVKHKVADMLTATKGARAAVYYAAMSLDAGTSEASAATSVAKAFAGEAMSALAGEALQTHGGIGFTWEHDLHLYLRRAKADEIMFGAPEEHYQRVVSLRESAPPAPR